MVIHRTFFTALNGTPTDDFTTVYSAIRRYLDGQAVYDQAYNHVDPLYLYNPGATLLLTPLGLIGNFDTARTAFILVNAAAIIAALALLTRLVGHRLSSWLWPVSIAAAFMTESVINTLAFSNINGILLLALASFLYLFLRAESPTNTTASTPATSTTALRFAAGLILGLAILIKPQFAPLLFIPLVKLDWRTAATAVITPAAFIAVAWPIVPDSGAYISKLMPYLATTRDYANSSWAGVQAYFGLSDFLYWPVWLAFAAATGAGVIALLRWHKRDPQFWALTTTGLLLVGVFFLSSLGQQYYSMWLFPMMFTAVLPRSVFHTWPAWLAATLFLLPTSWTSTLWPVAGRWLSFFTGSAGWALLIAVTAATALALLLADASPTTPPEDKSRGLKHLSRGA